MKLTRVFVLVALVGCAGVAAVPPAVPGELIATVDRVSRLLGPGWISTGDDDAHSVFAPDGRTLSFLKVGLSFDLSTLVSTTHGKAGWSRPEVVSFSGQYPDG